MKYIEDRPKNACTPFDDRPKDKRLTVNPRLLRQSRGKKMFATAEIRQQIEEFGIQTTAIGKLLYGYYKNGEIITDDERKYLDDFKKKYPNRYDWEEGLNLINEQYYKLLRPLIEIT